MEVASDEVSPGGRLILPWISRIARPDGVCRSCGRGLEELFQRLGLGPLAGERWRGIEGIFK